MTYDLQVRGQVQAELRVTLLEVRGERVLLQVESASGMRPAEHLRVGDSMLVTHTINVKST